MPDPRYGSAHQKTRAEWEKVVQAGQGWCCETVCVNPPSRGGRRIAPDVPGRPTGWHLAHTSDGQAYKGPAHAACNTSEAGRRGNPRGRPKRRRAVRAVRAWRPTRDW